MPRLLLDHLGRILGRRVEDLIEDAEDICRRATDVFLFGFPGPRHQPENNHQDPKGEEVFHLAERDHGECGLDGLSTLVLARAIKPGTVQGLRLGIDGEEPEANGNR